MLRDKGTLTLTKGNKVEETLHNVINNTLLQRTTHIL